MDAPIRIQRLRVKPVAADSDNQLKSYLDRLMKMIPGEVVGLYLVGSGVIPQGQIVPLAIWTGVCFVAVILVTSYGTSDPKQHVPPDWTHVAISAIAFLIWIYSIGGPFGKYAVPYIGSLLVLAWTFFIPLLYHGPID
jgi:hypothetical protein